MDPLRFLRWRRAPAPDHDAAAAEPVEAVELTPLADECEAFLAGYYLEHLRGTVPGALPRPWMWLNAVAHGTPREVRALADPNVVMGATRLGWRECRAVVAMELVELAAGRDRELHRLQQDALCPLEVDLAGEDDVTPAGLARLAVFALRVQTSEDA